MLNNPRGWQGGVSPFIDFTRADLRFNGEWLNTVSLPELVGTLAHVPVSMTLQREDVPQGHGDPRAGPEVIITAPLIEGTDGTGAKMSKSRATTSDSLLPRTRSSAA